MSVYFSVMLLLDAKTSKAIIELRNRMAEKYHIRVKQKYKKVPPHISLLFLSKNIGDKAALDITNQLRKSCMYLKPFSIELEEFDYFTKRPDFPNYLTYLKVKKSQNLEKLNALVNAHTKNCEKATFAEFIPHVTLIGTGKSKEKFLKVKNECQNIQFKRSFTVNSVFAGVQKSEKENWELTELKFGNA